MGVLARRTAISITVLLTACSPPPADVQHARDAEARAREWLAQINAGDYGGSWETSAPLFRSRLSKAEWEERAGRVQPSLGVFIDRELVAAKYTAALPWEVAGEHVLIQYRANYGGQTVVETVTMRYASDKQWRTIGYIVATRTR